MKTKLLPDSEFELMECIWALKTPATTPMLMERLGRERGWKIQTLATLLKRLCDRGFLTAQRGMGRELQYTSLISRQEYLSTETRQFVEKVHNNSFSSLLSALGGGLTKEELSELETFVQSAKEGGK